MFEDPEPSKLKPRRSCLYSPGINVKAMEKAKSLPADVVIFDLEDAVAPELKSSARDMIANQINIGGYGKREVVIRINDLNSPWGKDDLDMANRINPDAILVPKIKSAADIGTIDALLNDGIALWVMIETPMAILNITEIAAMAQTTKLSAFIIGTNDLAKEMRARMTPDRIAFQQSLGMTILAARSYDLIAIDGVYNDFQNQAGLEEECRQGQIMGFDGKSLIHPAQIDTANQIFAPNEDELVHAQAIITAFALPENSNKGVIKVDGKMTEILHLEQAKRTIAIHDAIIA